MMFSRKTAKDISYFTVEEKDGFMTRYTIVTIYFHTWWRRRKVIKFEWITTDIRGGTYTSKEPSSAQILVDHLEEIIKQNNE
jgi:hypothetical protein